MTQTSARVEPVAEQAPAHASPRTSVRTGAQYRESLRDGRRVRVLGHGVVDDVTTDELTRGVVDSFAEWYDRHDDATWRDLLWTSPEPAAASSPVMFSTPRTAEELQALGRAIGAVAFQNAGNLTHPPSYGSAISLGILDMVTRMDVPAERLTAAAAYRDEVVSRQLFITMGGNPVPADRFRAPDDRFAVKLEEERADGIVVSGMVGLHTATPYVDEVFVFGGLGPFGPDRRVLFSVPVNAPGATVVARKISPRHHNSFVSPLSHRYDELDAQLWLDRVVVPWNRVFATAYEFPTGPRARDFNQIIAWMLWHQLLGWLARADFTVGLVLAVSDAMNLTTIPGVNDQLIDLITDVESVRNAVYAAEHDPWTSSIGAVSPNYLRMGPGAITMMRNRGRMTELVRNLIGQAGMLTPADTDLDDPELAERLEVAYGGGRYTARQRVALLHLAADHSASALDAREASFEAHANGGLHTWRRFMQKWYSRYDESARRVLDLVGVDMPAPELDGLRDAGRR